MLPRLRGTSAHGRGCAAALLLLVAAALMLPSAAGANRVGEPDLVISKIVVSELPGTPPYIVVDQRDAAPGFIVRVVTTNVGSASTRKQSLTELSFLHHQKQVLTMTARVPALAFGPRKATISCMG